jgi:hypothetical protein
MASGLNVQFNGSVINLPVSRDETTLGPSHLHLWLEFMIDGIELLIISSMVQVANDSFVSLMSLVVWISPLPMHDNSHEFSRPAHMSPPYSPRSPTPVLMATSSPSADPMPRVDFRAMPIEPSAEIKQSSHLQ